MYGYGGGERTDGGAARDSMDAGDGQDVVDGILKMILSSVVKVVTDLVATWKTTLCSVVRVMITSLILLGGQSNGQ